MCSLLAGASFFAIFGQATTVEAARYYVRTSGDDENHGKNARKAFRTISKAARVAGNGDTVYVGAGTYTDPVTVLGAKAGVLPLRFVADTRGRRTGDRGAVILLGAPFRVSGSNQVEIYNFTFRSERARPVLWENSYNGLISRGQFVGGDQALLMKDGSLKLESCRLVDFRGDAIQVNGAAKLDLEFCSIDRAAGHGISVSKEASVNLNSSFVQNCVGDGVYVALTSDDVDVDPPDSDCRCTGLSPVDARRDALAILRSLDPEDPVFNQILQSAAQDIQDTLRSSNWQDDYHVVPSAGADVYETSLDAVEKMNAVFTDDVEFEIVNNQVVVKHPFIAELRVVGAAIKSGSTDIPVTVRMKVGSKTYQPFGSFNSPTAGNVNDGGNPRDYESPDVFQESETISIAGRSWLRRSGRSGRNDSDYFTYLTVDSNSNSPNVFVLRDGDDVPKLGGFGGQASAEEFLKPYLDESGRVKLKNNQVIFLFELGTTNINSSAADFQDLVTLVTMRRANHTPLSDQEKALLKQAIGLLLAADEALAVCAINEATCAEGRKPDLNEAHRHLNDGRAAEGSEAFMKASSEFAMAWQKAMDSIKNNKTDPADLVEKQRAPLPPPDWTTPIGEVRVVDSRITGNASGVALHTRQPLNASKSEFSTNHAWGVRLRGSFSMTDCKVKSNGEGGLYLRDMVDGDLSIDDLDIKDNVNYGVYFENPRFRLTNAVHREWDIRGSNYVLASHLGKLTVDGPTIKDGSGAGIYTHQGELTVRNATVADCGYGIATSESRVILDQVQLEKNSVGLYGNDNHSLSASGCYLKKNTVWGAVIHASNVAGATATFNNCTVTKNAGGISVMNARTGDFELKNTVLEDNSQSGLHFENCNLTINSQAADQWRTVDNLYGVSCNGSSLVFDHLTIENSDSYGLHSLSSTVVMNNSTIYGKDGAYSAGAGSLTVNASRIVSTGGSNRWGVFLADGGLELKSTLVKGFDKGVHLDSSNGQTGRVLNCTIADAVDTGIQVAGGTAEVRNTILSGSGSFGFDRIAGTLNHSHNLVSGFTTPYNGASSGESDLSDSPRFVDAANGDYRLTKGSVAINAGTDLSGTVATDLDGNARPSYKAFEIGAFEFMDDDGSFRILTWSEKR